MKSICQRKTYYTSPKEELHCIYFPLYPFYFVKAEILSNKPVIVEVYDVVTNVEATSLKEVILHNILRNKTIKQHNVDTVFYFVNPMLQKITLPNFSSRLNLSKTVHFKENLKT